jgi:hypothetical protein
LPQISRYPTAAIRYLQERGIHRDIISRCLQDELLYEGRYRKRIDENRYTYETVCVFLGKDDNGANRYACMRGITSDLKEDCFGSDKRYGFHVPASNPASNTLLVFEGAVDLLSHLSLQLRNGWQGDAHRLSLGCVAPLGLTSYLERHPQIRRVVLHLDNDRAGIKAAVRIRELLCQDSRFSHIRVAIKPPHQAKDYNDVLMQEVQRERAERQQRLAICRDLVP